MTSRTQILIAKQKNSLKLKTLMVARIIDREDELKNIAGDVLKNNSKKWKKNLEVLYLTSRSTEQCQPKHKQNHLKNWEIKQTKQNYTHC